MKIRSNRNYPYPIYSKHSDDYLDNDFDVDFEMDFDSENAILKFNVNIPNQEILSYIKNGDIGLYCNVECSTTKYRELFSIDLLEDGFEKTKIIPLEKLNDEIETLFLLVTKKDISDYNNSQLNDFYLDEKIVLREYSTVGFTDTFVRSINKRIDNNGDIPSIFLINKDENASIMTFDASNQDYIIINLPAEEYDTYDNLKGKYKRIKQAMINFPVLVDLLQQILSGNAEDYEGRGWYDVIENAIKPLGYSDFNDPNLHNISSTELAQKILKLIEKDALKELAEMDERIG